MSGKVINLFLMDSNPNGRIKCTLSNWTGIAYKIPRTLLEKARTISYLNQSGVYLLFGVSDETGNPIVYIGQAGIRKNGHGILNRWEEHKRDTDKDWWVEAVAFTTANNSFGPTEISYLENQFRNMALEAGRYEVTNGNEPTQGNLTEEKESEMEEFISYAKLVIGALGYKIFEPLVTKKNDEPELADSPEPVLYCNRRGAQAKGQRTAEGFALLAGSRISPDSLKSAPASVIKSREKYKDALSADGVVNKDLLFATPSGAAGFVIGGSVNGYFEWKTVEGQTLKDWEG